MNVLNLFLLMIAMAGCTFQRDKMAGGDRPFPDGSQKLQASYALVQETILQPKCLGCHSGKNAPDLSSYENVLTNLAKINEQAIVLKTMPKRQPLAANEIALLRSWIEAGAPLDAPAEEPTTPVDPVATREIVTWSEVNEKIFKARCISCHSNDNFEALDAFEDVESVRSSIKSIYAAVVINSIMPLAPDKTPKDAPNPNQLSRELKDLLGNWIADGMLDSIPEQDQPPSETEVR